MTQHQVFGGRPYSDGYPSQERAGELGRRVVDLLATVGTTSGAVRRNPGRGRGRATHAGSCQRGTVGTAARCDGRAATGAAVRITG